MSSFGLTKEQLQSANSEDLALLAADCLALLEPGTQPLPLFEQLARIMVLSTVEVVPFRKTTDKLEVLLAKRPEDDLWWPNQLHVPGTVLLPNDEEKYIGDYETPVQRIIDKEFANTITRVDDIHVFDVHRRSGARGSEQTVFCWTEVALNDGSAEPSGGEFFNANTVARQNSLIVGHIETINHAITHLNKS